MKKLLYILLFASLGVSAQTVGIKIATPIIKNNPADNTITGYANLLNAGYHIVADYHGRDSLITNFSTTLATGMLVYEVNVDSTYRWSGSAWVPYVNSATTIYTGDGTTTGVRTVTIGGNQFEITGTGVDFALLPDATTPFVTLQALTTTGAGNLTLEGNQVDINFANQTTGKTSGINFSNGSMLVTDDINDKGLTYANNYGANFTARSLIDKRYADSLFSTISGGVPTSRTLTINGTIFDLTANRTWTVGDALVANPLSQFAATTSAQLRTVLSDETGTGFAYFQGGDAGTPSALVGTNITGTGASFTAGNATKLATARNIQGVAFDGTAAINPINGTGFVKATGTTLSYDNSNYFILPSLTNHSVLFSDGSTIVQDNNNFYYDGTNHRLSVGVGGDFTGTNTINIYGQYDAYEPQSAIGAITDASTYPGVTASSSRGTGASPVINNTGDNLGGFSGWAYTRPTPAYTYMGGMSISAVGATSTDLGGQIDFYTKANNAATTSSRQTIANDGTITFSKYTTNGGLLFANGSGVVSQTGAGSSTTLLHGGTSPAYSAVSLTADVTGILPNANTTATTTPTASSIAAFDANSNLSANNFLEKSQTITGTGGTTTLTNASPLVTYMAATPNTVVLPVASTMTLNQRVILANTAASGNMTVQSSGGNTVQVMIPGSFGEFYCTTTSGTSAASWYVLYTQAAAGAYMDLTTNQTAAGNKTFTGNITQNNTGNATLNGISVLKTLNGNAANLYNLSYNDYGDVQTDVTTAGLLFGGSSKVAVSVASTGAFNNVNILTGNNFGHVIIGTGTVQTGVVVPWGAQLVVNKLSTATFFSSGALTNTAGIYINGQSTQGTNNYNFVSYSPGSTTTNSWFKYGLTRVSGFKVDSLLTGTAGTDNIIVDHGSGAVGSIPASSYAQSPNGAISILASTQTTLVAGTKALSITGVTTGSHAYVNAVSQGGTVSTTFEYAAVCTSGTVTITALTTGNVTNNLDTSTINVFVTN